MSAGPVVGVYRVSVLLLFLRLGLVRARFGLRDDQHRAHERPGRLGWLARLFGVLGFRLRLRLLRVGLVGLVRRILLGVGLLGRGLARTQEQLDGLADLHVFRFGLVARQHGVLFLFE